MLMNGWDDSLDDDDPEPDFWAERDRGFATLKPLPRPEVVRELQEALSLPWDVWNRPVGTRCGFSAMPDLFTVGAAGFRGTIGAIEAAVERLTALRLTVKWKENLSGETRALAFVKKPNAFPFRPNPLQQGVESRWRCIFVGEGKRIQLAAPELPAILPSARTLYVLESRTQLAELTADLELRFPGEVGSAVGRADNLDRRIYVARSQIFGQSVSDWYDVVVWPNASDILTVYGQYATASLDFFQRRVFAFRSPKELPGREDRRRLRHFVGEDWPLRVQHSAPYETYARPALRPSGSDRRTSVGGGSGTRLRSAAYVAKVLSWTHTRVAGDVGIDLDEVRNFREAFEPVSIPILAASQQDAVQLKRRLPTWPILDFRTPFNGDLTTLNGGRVIITAAFLSRYRKQLEGQLTILVVATDLTNSVDLRRELRLTGAALIHA